MAIDRLAWSAAVLSLSWGACVSSSIEADVSSVRSLSHAKVLPAVPEGQVQSEPADESKQLLKGPLDVDAAVRLGLLNNRELRARLRELGVARARVMQAGLVKNPLFEAEILPERDSDVELRVEYEITSLLLAPQKRHAEQFELEAARLDAAAAVVALGYDVRGAFYALAAAEQRLGIAQQTLDALAAARDAGQALLEAGNVPQLEASTQIAAYERARIRVAELELERLERREALARLLGLYGEATSFTTASELEPLPEAPSEHPELEKHVLEASFDLKASEQRLRALAKRTGVARTEGWLPDVSVDVHSLKTDPEGPDDKEWRWGGGVAVEVPLFDHGQGQRRGYEAQFDALLERFQGQAIALRSFAREARGRLASAHARARQYQTVIVPAQHTVFEQTLLQYNAMQLSIFQLLEARRALLDTQLTYVDILREYWTAAAALEALLAGGSPMGMAHAAAPGVPLTATSEGGL
jgi:cobalt-zinc-cadmium efflux system outer membrane protein